MEPTTAEKFARLTRQELTFVACDVLAKNGRKPSVALVREQTIAMAGIKKGSDGDVQEDIRLWYDGLFALKRDAAIDGLPERMASLFRATWHGAVELAEEGLAHERAKLGRERERAAADVERARGLAETLRHDLELARADVGARDAAIARLDGAVAQDAAEIVQLTAKMGAKDERIEALSSDLARKATEQAASFAELDGARRHALLQIDQARGEGRHWKEQYERADQEGRAARGTADAYRSKAGELEAQLAGANAKLGATLERVALDKIRVDELSAQLAAAQDGARRQADALSSARIAVEAANARLEAAAREIGASKEAVAQARERERHAIEEAAELRGASAAGKN